MKDYQKHIFWRDGTANRKNLKALLAACLLFVAIGSTAVAEIYVDGRASGMNDGSSWKDAYNHLQDALIEAGLKEKPVEIWVAQGTYRPDLGRRQTLHDQKAVFQLIDGVTLMGGFAGVSDSNVRDTRLYESILSGDLTGNDAAVKHPRDLLNESTRADNSDYVVDGSKTDATAVLDGFTIIGGGHHGLYNKSGNPTIIDCTFRGNRAERWGGGLCNENGNPRLRRCTFTHNAAPYGGGIWNANGSPVLISCVFSGNSANFGGGMYSYNNSHPQITNCTFHGNLAKYGAGIYNNNNCRPALTNCTLTGNLAESNGGAIRNVHSSRPVLNNCILWGDAPDEIMNFFVSSLVIRHSNIQDGADEPWFGEGCIDNDPLFVGADDLRLAPGSPCIDTGDNKALPSELTRSLDDKPRIVNGTVDMGAFEAAAI